jgi:protein SCO1/2
MLKKYWFFILTMLTISLVAVVSFYNVLTPEKKLPIYQPSMVKFQLVDSTIQHVKRFHKIDDFSLVNQNNEIITNETYDGKIYIADFFFTTCPGICPIMKENMIVLQDEFINDDDVLLLSHTVTPEIDSVYVLKKYSQNKGVIDSKWNMVTGDKKQIYNLARKSYLVAEDIVGQRQYDMIHTENFVLVDSKRRIRGFYDGTDIDVMNNLISDIKILKKEEFK